MHFSLSWIFVFSSSLVKAVKNCEYVLQNWSKAKICFRIYLCVAQALSSSIHYFQPFESFWCQNFSFALCRLYFDEQLYEINLPIIIQTGLNLRFKGCYFINILKIGLRNPVVVWWRGFEGGVGGFGGGLVWPPRAKLRKVKQGAEYANITILQPPPSFIPTSISTWIALKYRKSIYNTRPRWTKGNGQIFVALLLFSCLGWLSSTSPSRSSGLKLSNSVAAFSGFPGLRPSTLFSLRFSLN